MGIAVTYVVYLLISVALTVFVGSALSRSGRIFLLDAFGGEAAPAQAASRLVVVGFYLLNLGFITLTMRMSGEIGSARQAIQVLSAKIGEVLLVLGVLYLANIGFLTRLKRRAQAYQPLRPGGDRTQPPPPPPRGPETTAPPEPRTADSTTAAVQAAPASTAAQTSPATQTSPAAQTSPATQSSPAAQTSPATQTVRATPGDPGLWRPRPRQALH